MSVDFLLEQYDGLSIVIPALNEPYLPILENKLEGFFYKIPHEIIIRDDKGCGNAILAGIRKSYYHNILVMDGDGSHSPLSAWCMYQIYKGNNYDIIHGYKKYSGDSWFRKTITFVFDFLARLLIKDCPDLMSGMFIFNRIAIKPLPEKISHPKVLMYIIKKNPDINIGTYGIHFMKRVSGKSKLGKPRIAFEILKGMIWG